MADLLLDSNPEEEKNSTKIISEQIIIDDKNDFQDKIESKNTNQKEFDSDMPLKINNPNPLINVKNIFIPPSNLHPISYVDFIEKNYIYFFSEPTSDSFFQLTSYRQKNQIKCTILEFPENKEIDKLIYNRDNQISSVAMHYDYLFIGDQTGVTQMYSYKKKQRIKVFEHNDVKNQAVTSIDISKDGTLMVTGHINGYISIWLIEESKLLKSITDRHSSRIACLKFINNTNNNKKITIVSSDIQGQVQKIILEKKLLKYNIIDDSIYKDKFCTYIVEIFNPEKERDLVIAAFGTVNKIRIYQLEPQVTSICEFERPNNINEGNITPDVAIGYGLEPSKDRGAFMNNLDDEYLKEHILLAISWDQVIKIYSIDIEKVPNEENENEPFDYNINISNEGRPCGHFVNDNSIIRLGFFSSSLIFYFDQNKRIKIFNTALINYGEYRNNSKSLSESKKALLEEGKCIDPDMLCDDISFKGEKLFSYRNFVICNNKNISLLCKQNFHKGKLLGYEESLNLLKNESKWLDALCIGLDIYKGLLTSFPDIPLNEEKRKADLTNYLGEILSDYIQYETKKELTSTNQDRKNNNNNCRSLTDDFIRCIRITIEFCISIKAVDYLFQEVQDFFSSYSDDFFRNVEPFIFCGKLKSEKIASSTISSLIASYVSRKQCIVLSHLITHLNFDSINNELIKASCVKYNLLSSMIYIYSNGKNAEEFFTPIKHMYNYFIDDNNFKDESISDLDKYDNYNEIIKNEGINKMVKTKNFIGHKLCWYIDMCLNGKKLCLNMDDSDSFRIKSQEYKDLIAMIYVWLMDKKIFDVFIKFDSFTFFFILTKLFSNEILIDIIKNYNYNIEQNEIIKKFYNCNGIEIPKDYQYTDIKQIIKEIINRCQEFKSIFISLDIDMFIIRIGTIKKSKLNKNIKENNNINEEVVNELLVNKFDVFSCFKNILNYFINLNKIKDEELIDQFNCHGVILDKSINNYNYFDLDKCPENVKVLSKEISKILIELLESEFKFSPDELETLLEICSCTNYLFVKIKLLELTNRFGEVLEEYIKNGKLIGDYQVFKFINSKLIELKSNPDNFIKCKKGIIQKIKILSELSMEKTIELIDNYFKNEPKSELIESFSDADLLKYEYINKLLNYDGCIYNKLDSNQDISYTLNITYSCLDKKDNVEIVNKEIVYTIDDLKKEFSKILMIHFELLIKFDKIKELLKLLKKKLHYFKIDVCIQKCLEKEIKEPAVFLLFSSGDFEKALDLEINDLNKKFILLKKQIINQNENEESIENATNSVAQCLESAIQICENSTNLIDSTNNEKIDVSKESPSEILWFKLLKVVYSIYDELKEQKLKNEIDDESYKKLIINASMNVEKLLSTMCLFVRMGKIIEIITSSYQEAEIKEFKSLLIKISNSFSRYKETLSAAKKLIRSSIIHIKDNSSKKTFKGNVLKFTKCDYCKRAFDNKEKIIVFSCGHNLHSNCNEQEWMENISEPVCIICKKTDMENININEENEKKNKNIKKIKNAELNKQKEYKDFLTKKIKKMNKLRDLDKGYFERINKFDNDKI